MITAITRLLTDGPAQGISPQAQAGIIIFAVVMLVVLVWKARRLRQQLDRDR